jgi:hypothetical protein
MSKNSILFINVRQLWSVPVEVLDASWSGRLIPEEESPYILIMRLCEPQSWSGPDGEENKP